MDEYMAKISFFGFNWVPQNYMLCQGQLVSVAENQALFSLVGPNFGSYSSTQFSLPDLRGRVLRGRVVVGQGSASWGTFQVGQTGGSSTITLTTANMPAHTHTGTIENVSTSIKVSGNVGVSSTPGGKSNNLTLAGSSNVDTKIYNAEVPSVVLNTGDNTVNGSVTIGATGSGQAFSNMQPYLTLNACILTNGLYPPRT